MRKAIKISFCLAFSFIFIFLCVGYAQLTDTLFINGKIDVAEQTGVYITDVIIPADADASVNSFFSTIMNSTVNLGEDGSNTVTFTVNFYNNSDETFSYDGVTFGSGSFTYSNEHIVFDVDTSRQNFIFPHGTLSLPVTFYYENGTLPDEATEDRTILNSVLKFNFVKKSGGTNVSVIEGTSGNDLDALVDGSTTLDYSEGPYWSNRDPDTEEGIGGSTTLKFEWDDAITFDSMSLYYYLDTIGTASDQWRGSCDFPESVEIYYLNPETGEYELLVPTKTDDYKFNARRNNKTGLYEIKLDGSPKWTTLDSAFSGKAPASTYEFGTDITTTSVKIVLQAKPNYHVGLIEVDFIDN